MIKREEVLKQTINAKSRKYFDELIEFMQE